MIWTIVAMILAFLTSTSLCGYLLYKYALLKNAADGVCIRADDGEVYLRLSEGAQIKLADPSTKVLRLRVTDVSTRNNHPL